MSYFLNDKKWSVDFMVICDLRQCERVAKFILFRIEFV